MKPSERIEAILDEKLKIKSYATNAELWRAHDSIKQYLDEEYAKHRG